MIEKTHGYHPNGRTLCGALHRIRLGTLDEEDGRLFNLVELVDCKRCWWVISTWAESLSSGLQLLELAGVYRAMASGILAERHIIDRVTDVAAGVLYQPPRIALKIDSAGPDLIQEGLPGVDRLPEATAHALNVRDFPIPVTGKTGTTNEFRDALFVGSTYGSHGITVAVRIGFDDNRELGDKETGGRAALPIFREIMLRVYQHQLAGPVPEFPPEIERRIDQYLARQAALTTARLDQGPIVRTPDTD